MGKVLQHQGYHLLAFVGVGALLWLVTRQLPEHEHRIWGLSVAQWTAFSWLSAMAFQGSALFFWRTELYHHLPSAWLGRHAFTAHRIAFVTLGAARFVPLVPISLGSMNTSPLPPWASFGLIALTTPPILWTLYGVHRYFGFNRVVGADHFDPSYRTRGLETRGVFRYVPNAMYTLGFLLFYHPALLWQSRLGLIVTAAHHLLVWCHYFCTERPDLREIYGSH